MRALFLRGLTREIRHWNGFPEMLKEKTGAEVLTLDLPGSGINHHQVSPKEINLYIEALRKQVGPGSPIVLIGISMGGMIALRWAELYPQEIHSVFAINTSAKNITGPAKRFNPGLWKSILKIITTAQVSQKEKEILNITTNKLSESKKAEILNLFVRIQKESPVSLISSINQLLAARKFVIYSPLKVPTTLIYSLGDRLVSPKCSIDLARLLKADLEVHPDAGHDLPLDDPQWLLSVIMKHLKFQYV